MRVSREMKKRSNESCHCCSPLTFYLSCSAVIGDVRGKGFLLGVELVTDHEKKTPAKAEISRVMNHMKGIHVVR